MNEKDITGFRRLLLERRALLLQEVTHAETDLMQLSEERESEFEEHAQEERMAQLLVQLDDRGKAELERIDAALTRIAVGRFGECEACGNAIAGPRLAALPETPYCRDCAERAERGEPLDIDTAPRPQPGALRPDYSLLTGRELEEVIREHIRADGRVDIDEVRVVCRRGVVYLDGVIPSDREHQILVHTVTEVMGLSEIVDRLEIRQFI